MKVPMRWLKEYVDFELPAGEYTDRMIMSGTGVEGIERTGESFSGVVAGRILEIKEHENSDHLKICRVDVGDRIVQIVTGAPNVAGGQLVPVALDGAVLPGGKIKSGKLRGELSEGMLCSGPELEVPEGLYPHVGDEGILIFGEDYPPGTDVKEIFGLGDEVVDFEILANRPDCLSVWGVARETAAALDKHLILPEIAVEEGERRQVTELASVEVRDNELCPRYCARVITNVNIGPSPMWIREYLHGAGVRPINNIVDITNFIMLETGHPMHAFDLSKVRDRAIVVRRAREGEELTTLDGKQYALTSDMLVIADRENATGLAGIMGGEESEITDSTREVLFECAAFDRANVRVTSRALGIRTESSGRFERGVCAATAAEAIDRACMLVNMLDCGDVARGTIDIYPRPAEAKQVRASIEGICRRTGVDISGEEMKDILERLFFDVELEDGGIIATPPIYRTDIETEADISEEVLRLYGYDAIPSTLMRGETAVGRASKAHELNSRARRALVGMGFYEIVTYSFVSPSWAESLRLNSKSPMLDPVRVRNPLGEDTSVMRTSLLPSMLNVMSTNIHRSTAEGRLFEVAPVFMKRGEGELPDERPQLIVGAYGGGVDFYTLKGAVERLLTAFGVEAEARAEGENYFHPGRRAVLSQGGRDICELGEVHPDVAARFDVNRRALVAIIDLRALAEAEVPVGHIVPLPKYPAVTRDLALVMDEGVEVGPILAAMKRAAGRLHESVKVFDIYRGEQLGGGKKSVAFSITLRSPDATLTEAETGAVIEKILVLCADSFDAHLRE